jgi:hypothetical protein
MARKSKKEMLEFLNKHSAYRSYHNNGRKYFAKCVKLYEGGWVPYEYRDTAYALLEMEEPYEDIRFFHIADFEARHAGYTISFDGRSCGYLVLMYKDTCREISLDGDEDYRDVKALYDLVKDFDKTVEDCKNTFLYYCKNYIVEEETINVPTVVNVLKEKTEQAA